MGDSSLIALAVGAGIVGLLVVLASAVVFWMRYREWANEQRREQSAWNVKAEQIRREGRPSSGSEGA